MKKQFLFALVILTVAGLLTALKMTPLRRRSGSRGSSLLSGSAKKSSWTAGSTSRLGRGRRSTASPRSIPTMAPAQ